MIWFYLYGASMVVALFVFAVAFAQKVGAEDWDDYALASFAGLAMAPVWPVVLFIFTLAWTVRAIDDRVIATNYTEGSSGEKEGP